MTKVILDEVLRAKLNGLKAEIELCDPSGETVGHFLPENRYQELVGAHVAYRKLVSPSPSQLLPEDQCGLYAVVARWPYNLSGQIPWQRVQAGVGCSTMSV